MKQAIFFDLDGTLWDAIDNIKQSWNETMIRLNEPYRFTYDVIKSTMGLTPKETLPITFPGAIEKHAMFLFQECIKDEIKYLAKYPGILYKNEEEVLTELCKKYPLYVVSNSDCGYIENYISACDMEKYFKGHLCAGDTKLDKWQNIKLLKEKENIDDVIYVGDTLKDKNESNKAGVKFIHANYGFGIIENDEYKIDSLDELVGLVETLFNNY